jgi:hypothetical protein
MGLQDYIKSQASEGELDSAGSFTLDLSKAADKLATFALPSHVHYLLKIVQVAHHLCADKVSIKIERCRTVVRFKAPTSGTITDSEAIYKAFYDPLLVEDPMMVDLVSALIGTITEDNLETLWSYSEGRNGRRVFINRQRRFSIQDFTLTQAKDPDEHPCAFTLSVLHPKTWKFWQGARRRAAAAKVLEDNCRYSGAKIRIDGRELDIHPSSVLNDHLRERSSHTQDGYTYWREDRVAADNILFDMAPPQTQRFNIKRPSLSAYVVREDYMNLWASGTRIQNTLKPDGESSAAWMLQFLQDGDNVSMRFAPKRVPVRAALALNAENSGKDEDLRIKIIRNGVTVLEQSMTAYSAELRDFKGCILAFADSSLETDLTGLQVIQNEEFLATVKSFQHLIPMARSYFERGKKMLTM